MANLLSGVSWLWNTTGFPPRWLSGYWPVGLGWTHIVADLLIWAAYFTIPFLLWRFIRQRQSTPYLYVFILFSLFIFLCGLIHMVDAIIFWWPVYRLNTAIKVVTALVSWVTVIVLFRILPSAVQLKSTEEMEREIEERTRTILENEARSRQMARFTRLSNRIGEYGYETNDFLETMTFALHEVRTMLDWELGHIYLYDARKREFYSSEVWSCQNKAIYSELIRLSELSPIPKGQGLVGLTADIRSIRWVSKIAYDTPFVLGKRLLAGGIMSFLGIPIVVNGQTIAVMEYLNPQIKVTDDDIIEYLKLIENTLSRFKERLDINQQRQSYITTLTHDMKTPLKSEIYLFKKMMEGHYGDVSERHKPLLRDMHQSAQYMLNMVDNVLTNFKLGYQAIQLTPVPVDLNQLVNKICTHDVQGLAEERGHTIHVHVDHQLPKLMLDEQAIRRVIYNLLQNAIDYTPVGETDKSGGQIHVVVARANHHAPARAVITVIDSGHGVPDDQRHLLFSATNNHVVARAGEKPRYRGTGLGLFVCQQLVEAHHGTITYTPADGQYGCYGACFTIELPITPAVAPLVTSGASARQKSEATYDGRDASARIE